MTAEPSTIACAGRPRPTKARPWCWQEKAARRLIRDSADGFPQQVSGAAVLGVYDALTEIASDEQAERFTAAQAWIALKAGLTRKTIQRVLPILRDLGLIAYAEPQGFLTQVEYTLLPVVPKAAPLSPGVPTTLSPSVPTPLSPCSFHPTCPTSEESVEESLKECVREGTPTPLWPEAIPDQTAMKIAEDLHLTESAVRSQWTVFRRRKLGYGDKPPPTEADVWNTFEGWLEGHQPKRNSRSYGNTADYSKVGDSICDSWAAAAALYGGPKNSAPVVESEPVGWSEAIKGDEDLGTLAGRTWALLNPEYRRRIIKLMEERP